MADIEPTLLEIIKEHAVYEVEEKLGVEVPFNANENPFGDMKTVGDMIDALNELIKK